MDRAKSAFIYCRISEDRSGAGLGVERQESDCREAARQLGLDVLEVFVDNDISAYRGRVRPGYKELLARLHEVSHVIVWHTDRLHRQPKELEEYLDASDANGIATHSVTGGTMDLTTPEGRMNARMGAMLASYESEHRGERISRKARESIRQGRHVGGPRPFGWNLKERTQEEKDRRLPPLYLLNEKEAEALRKAAQDVLDGRSIGSIVREWNDPAYSSDGPLTTVRGNPWNNRTLTNVLRRDRNAGIATIEGAEVAREAFPVILDYHLWRAVVRKLEGKRSPGHTNKAKYLLSGIAECHCGQPVRMSVSQHVSRADGSKVRRRVYTCPVRDAGHVTRVVPYVDDVVKLAVLDFFTHPYLLNTAPSTEERKRAAELEEKLTHISHQEADLGDMWAKGTLSTTAVQTAQERLNRERQELEAELAGIDLAKQPVEGADFFGLKQQDALYRDWLSWHLDDQRDFIRQNFRVILHPYDKTMYRRYVDPHATEVLLMREAPRAHVKVTKPDGTEVLTPTDEVIWFGDGDRLGPYYGPDATYRERHERFRSSCERVLRAYESGESPAPLEPSEPRPVPRWRQGQAES